MTRRLAFMLAVALGACAGSGTARVDYASDVTVRSPELVTVDADLYTLADSDEPVFYTDNSYWLYRNERWYRSNHYDRDWVYVREPAPRLRRIERPTAYIRYRSTRTEAHNVPAPRHDDSYNHHPYQPPSPERPSVDHERDHDIRPNPPGHDVRQVPPRERGDDRRATPPVPRVDHDRDDDRRGNKPHGKDKGKKDKKHDH